MRPLLSTHEHTSRKQQGPANTKGNPNKVQKSRAMTTRTQRIISPAKRRQAARYLQHARTDIRLHLLQKGKRKAVPEPFSFPFTVEEYNDENIKSDSSETDSDPVPSDHEGDVLMGEPSEAGNPHIPLAIANHLSPDEQRAIQHFDFDNSTSVVRDIAEEEQDEENDEDIEEVVLIPTDTYCYPDPQTSEIVPPPTPRLSHMDLPYLSIEIDDPEYHARENRGEMMEESKEGDLSGAALLKAAPNESPLVPAETDRGEDALRADYEDEDLESISDMVIGFLDEIDTSVRDADPIDAVQQKHQKADLADIVYRICQQPWWQKVKDLLKTERDLEPSAVPEQAPSLPCVGVHHHDRKEGPATESNQAALPEQSSALAPDYSPLSSENAEQQEVSDDALTFFMQDMERMEAETLARSQAAKDARKMRCRRHNALDNQHFWGDHLAEPLRVRILVVHGDDEPQKRYPPSSWFHEKQRIKHQRFLMPLWKRHAVWTRTGFCMEIFLVPSENGNGDLELRLKYHEGRGLTGGNPFKTFWRHCDENNNGCEAL